MNPLKDLLTGGLTGIVDSIGGVIGKFVTSPEEKLKAQIEVTKIATDFQSQVLSAERDLAVQQATVITAEIKSESWLARNWRPILMLTFTFIIAWNYIFVPILGAFTDKLKPAEIVPDMWQLLKLGVSGYIVGRSAEKIVPDVVAAIKK